MAPGARGVLWEGIRVTILDRIRQSLVLRLTLLCLAGLVAVGVVNISLWLTKFNRDIDATFVTNSRETTEVMAQAVTSSVWNFDSGGAQETLAGFLELSGLVYAEVFADSGSFVQLMREGTNPVIADEGQAVFAQTDAGMVQSGDFLIFRQAIVHEVGGEIGVVVTAFSRATKQALIAEARRETVVTQVLSYGLLALLLIAVFHGVTRPLVGVTAVIDDVTSGRLDREVPYLDRADEVGRLAHAVEHFRDNAQALIAVEAEAEANRISAIQAEIDDLTQLPNRRALTNLFDQIEADVAQGGEGGIALLHMDLDGFKQINDTLGHKAGDHVLETVAERLQAVSEACRMVARIGGDEFVAVMTGLHPGDNAPNVLADAVIRSLRAPIPFEGQTVHVGCSVGIAYHEEGKRDLLSTLVHADIALYKAKANGKDQWVEFDEEQRRALMTRKQLTDQIRTALDEGQFIPYFQPIVAASSGEIVGLEVLSRWAHPEQGILEPAAYIDLAKELKLIRFIDRTILEQSVAVMQALSRHVPELPRLSVNVSTERLIEPDLLKTVEALKDGPIRLNIELLESSYLDDVSEQTLWRLDQLRDLGVGIHIDDFGTGHASLAGLLRVAPDVMKIDRRFVMGAPQSHKELAVLESLIGMAAQLGIGVVCEGVETPEQFDLVRKLGCDMIQGFLLHRPMDEAHLRKLLADAAAA